MPQGLTLNTSTGVISGTPTVEGTSSFKVQVSDSETPARTTTAQLGITVQLSPLIVMTTSLPSGTTGVRYSATLTATGGVPFYSWGVAQGSNLPSGLVLSGTGTISGTPASSGTFSFTVQVSDTLLNTATANLNITINAASLVITTTTLPQGTVSVPYNATLGAAGGVPPYAWSILSGNLPAGLNLNAGSGLISGTPTTPEVSNFTVQVKDSEQNVAQAPLQIAINAATNNAALSGPYAFSFNGYNNGTPVLMAGSFVANGSGNITGGVLDFNNGGGSPSAGYSLTGTYMITADGLGTMQFTVATRGVMNFHLAVSQFGNGTFVQDNQDPNTRGSGVLYVQTPANFAVPP